ncbi:MAG: M56 family metallopeptidase [Oscillibacter sp.]|nr:M56 family metallopeptidase [Oscillibacter sp.]
MSLLQMSTSGGILILAVAFLRLFTLRVLPKRTFLILWAVVLIRLLIPFPPLFRVSLSAPDFLSGQTQTIEVREFVNAAPSARDASPEPPPIRVYGNAAENPRPAQRPQAQAQTQNVAHWFRIVWGAGAVIVGAFFVIVYAIGYRKFRQAFPVEHDAARAWMKTHTLKRKYAVKSFGGLDSPMTYGVLRPVIVVPGAASWWDGAEAKFALEHEYIHMRRFDAAFKFALALALTVHWFNPAVWALYALANRDIELSCDEEALNRLGGTQRAAYARALLAEEERRCRTPVPFAGFGTNATQERIVEIMKYRKKSVGSVVLAAFLTLTLAACSVTGSTNETAATNETSVTAGSEGVANAGFRLSVPPAYKDLLVIETPQNDPDGVLFSVSEKASIEAAKALGEEYDGVGWLFSINVITEDAFHEALCYDMSGQEVFAKDADGQYYMYYHPTDVRLVRENYDNQEDLEQWTTLNEWAATVPDTFLSENSRLVPEKRGNNALDMYLARIAYLDGTKYTLSTTEYGPMDGDGFDASAYVESLTKGVTFEPVENEEAPDGEYIVLSFPDDDIRFDFFRMEGKTHYIRQVWSGDNEMLYRAVFENGDHASDTVNIMSEWYNALVAKNTGEPPETSGFTGEEFVGEWQDSYSQRAVMSVKKTAETGVYDVLIHWGGSYNSAVQWRMKAVAGAQDEILQYENGVKAEITFPDDPNAPEQETLIWSNGKGYLRFRDGYLTWYDEKEPQAADCRFTQSGGGDNAYSGVTTLNKTEVEAFAAKARQAYLDEDWKTISTMIRYPITMYPDVKVNNAEEFLSYMSDKVVSDGDRAAMEEEDCNDLFFNGQGICLATGSVWFLDVNFDGVEQVDAPLLRIISVSGLEKAD